MDTKVCRICGREFSATTDYFYRRKDAKDGLRAECKECKLGHKILKGYKECSVCHKILPRTSEYFNKGGCKDGFDSQCKECKKLHYQRNKETVNERHRNYYYSDLERERNRHKNYREKYPDKYQVQRSLKEHRRRTLEKSVKNTLTPDEWKICKEYFNNECCYCGRKLTHFTQDHFVPLLSGGDYAVYNILPACKSCNSSKHDYNFFEWYPQKKYYSEERKNKIIEYLTLKGAKF